MLAAFVAMLGKQWLNRYLKNSGGSMIERCGDRQRKCDGLEKWPLHLFVESLPVMLQVALLLLACGLCRHMWTINTSVAFTLISLTGLGVAFYVVVLIAGMSSYACPFQTAASIVLRRLWKKVRRGIVSLPVRSPREHPRTRRIWKRGVKSLLRRQSLPAAIPLENIEVHQSEPWMKPMDLAVARRTNVDDVQCVSWILRNITDPEALDAAIRLAGNIRWFEDGIYVDPPYDLIVSIFKACFDPTERVYPGSRDRAYYSGRALMWIHTLAMCKSKDFATAFPLPSVRYPAPGLDPDLEHLLQANYPGLSSQDHIIWLISINPENSPSHLQFIFNVLLHLAWANRPTLNYELLLDCISKTEIETTLPLNATLNQFLMWCILLGSPVEEEALKIQDKSYDISFFPSHFLQHSSPVTAWNRSYIKCPKPSVQPSAALMPNVDSSRTCCATWSSWKPATCA